MDHTTTPRDDGHTIDVGYVHTTDGLHCCLETCPHPDHNGPVLVAMDTRMKAMLDDWISDLGLTAEYMPTEPSEGHPYRTYTLVVPPGHALNKSNPLSSLGLRR